MKQLLTGKAWFGTVLALAAICALLVRQLHVSEQAAISTAKTAEERDKAAQIDRDDNAAIKRIRERHGQQPVEAPKQ